jgi:prepilin-type N-terminal cleavage/methylation domain-containing protein
MGIGRLSKDTGENMHNRKPRGGFTLVELLTVIVIIGLLVAMVSVAVMNARVTAQKAAITAEISQLDIAMTRLASEHGDAFPPDFSSLNSMGGQGEIAAYFSNDVTRYLNKRFPNYRPKNVDQTIRALYSVNPTGTPQQVDSPCQREKARPS